MKYIYKIINTKTNRIYIGQTYRFEYRMSEHKRASIRGNHHCKLMQEDYNKYGINSFTFEVLDEVDDKNVEQYEDYYINLYGGINNEFVYNHMTSVNKCDSMKLTLHNLYKGVSHKDRYGEEKAEQMRKVNSEKHKGKSPMVIPHKGKVKTIEGNYIVITKQLYNQIHTLRGQGKTIQQIADIVGIRYNGVSLIVKNKIYLPFKCND